MLVYQATNEKTGETITGIAREIGKKIGIDATTIRVYANTGRKAKKCWSIEKVTNEDRKVNQIPKEVWDEWVRVTAPFKKAIVKKQRRKLMQQH